jgi:hypothetical protein
MAATTHIGQVKRPLLPAPPGPVSPRGSSPLRLFRFERRWLLQVFETVLPAGEPALPLGAADVPMGRFLDDFLARAPLQAVLGLRAGLWMLVLAPLVSLRRPRTFLGLSAQDRAALIDRFRRSNHYLVRESATLFKIVGCLGFCGLGPIQQRIGIYPVDQTLPSWAREEP